MVDSNEEINNKVNTEDTMDANKARKENFVTEQESDAQSIEAKQINKMLLVEETVKKHPMFIAMQTATHNRNTNFMLEAIVENYFELTSENNTLANQEFYTVNDGFVHMALQSMAYLINVEENGIVLDENGNFDKDASAKQQMQAAYSQALKNEIAAEMNQDPVEHYKEMLKSNDNTHKESVNFSYDIMGSSFYREQSMEKTHMFLDYLYNQNSSNELSNDESKSALDNMLKDTVDSTQETKRNLLIGTKAEFNVLFNAMLYTYVLNNNNPDFNKMAGYLEEIAKNDKKGQFIDPETGSVDSTRVVKTATKFHDAYRQKSNFEILQKFQKDKRTFEELKPDEQKKVLSSIWSLYKQPPSPERDYALGVMMQVSGPSIKKADNQEYIIDEHRFLNLYNATIEKPIDIKKMNEKIEKKDLSHTNTYLRKMRQKIRDGIFQEFELPEGASPEEVEKFKNESIAKLASEKRPTLKPSEEVRLNRALEGFIKKSDIEGTKPEIIIAAYHLLESKNVNGVYHEKKLGILKKFIENNTSTFGEYIYKGEITSQALDIEDTHHEQISDFLENYIEYQEKQDRIKEKGFSKERVQEQVDDLKYFIKNGIKYLGDKGKAAINNLFKRQKQLPEAQTQHVVEDVSGELSELFDSGTEEAPYLEKTEVNGEERIVFMDNDGHTIKTISEEKYETMIMSEQIAEVDLKDEAKANSGNSFLDSLAVGEDVKNNIRAIEKRAAEMNKNSEDSKGQKDSDVRDTADEETKDVEDYSI